MLFTLSNQRSLQAAADTTLAMYGLQLQRAERRTVNGLPAIVTLSRQQAQDQQTGATSSNAVISYFIEYGGMIYVIHGVSTEADFASYAPTMEASMKTFAQLTDASRINVKPMRVHVKKAPRAGTLASTLSYYNMPQAMMAELALLNNMELNEPVPAGKYIKIVSE
jgi:predicted Zn-dependent protease